MVLLVDTNVLMHCRALDDCPWSLLGDDARPDAVEIAIARVVMRELDDKKFNAKQRLADRVRRVTSRLFEIAGESGTGRTRHGYAVRILDWAPTPEAIVNRGLSPSVYDDQLICTAMALGETHEVRIATTDLGLALKARAHNQSAIVVPDTLYLPTEQDPSQRQIGELTRRVEELESDQPELELRIEPQLATIGKLKPLTSAEVEVKVQQWARTQRGQRMHAGHRQRLGEYYVDVHNIRDAIQRTIAVRPSLLNTGPVAASDIDVELELRHDTRVMLRSDRPHVSAPPLPPVEALGLRAVPFIHEPGPRRITGPTVRASADGHRVLYKVLSLKQNRSVTLPAFYVTVADYAECTVRGVGRVNARDMREDVEIDVSLVVTGGPPVTASDSDADGETDDSDDQ